MYTYSNFFIYKKTLKNINDIYVYYIDGLLYINIYIININIYIINIYYFIYISNPPWENFLYVNILLTALL